MLIWPSVGAVHQLLVTVPCGTGESRNQWENGHSHTLRHPSTLTHTLTHSHTLRKTHTHSHWDTLRQRHTHTLKHTLRHTKTPWDTLWHTHTHWDTPQHTHTHSGMLKAFRSCSTHLHKLVESCRENWTGHSQVQWKDNFFKWDFICGLSS